jgi:hypothetical protein
MISAFTVFSLPALNAHIVIGFNVDPVVHACDVRQVNGTIKQCGVGDIARLYRAAQKIFTIRQGVERQADCWPCVTLVGVRAKNFPGYRLPPGQRYSAW